jgi:zinc protease
MVDFARTKKDINLWRCHRDKQLAALKVLVTENERAKKFGFTEGELNRAKSEFLASSKKL